ncbi:hypothetical protein I3760_04G070200 [Carya illinoinensis]|nr:hypothetical protein I3760_04G070200 [Carya illinoinensis]
MKNSFKKFLRPSQEELTQGRKEEKETTKEDKEEEVAGASTAAGAASETLGIIEFDPSDSFVATGGIARKIRIYSLSSLLPHESSHGDACNYYICTPAKLSSLRWKPSSGGHVLGSGDYDGGVMEYDLQRRTPIFEREEHGGRRVWSMWDPRCEGGRSVATVQPDFNPAGGALVAVGCADRRAYRYDIRKLVDPIVVFDGHGRTVTYVRFLDAHRVVSAGTDGCLKLWNINESRVIRTYKGHVNNRSFVGLPVWRNGGLLGCGVCWRKTGDERCTLLAGGSDGDLQLFLGKRKPILL